MKNNMTIDQMIAAGMPWDQIKARINQLQKEQKEKEIMKAAREAEKAQKVAVSRDRFLIAFIDWLIVEGILTEEDRAEFSPIVLEACEALVVELRQLKMFTQLYNKIK